MALQVHFIEKLQQIVDPVAEFLNHDLGSLGLLETQHVIVPTAGVRAWLVPQLAERLGTADGRVDGIVSNVRFDYVGSLNAMLRNGVDNDNDEWSIDHLTMVLLRVLSSGGMHSDVGDKYGGPLRAARAIADRFDRYAARRPQMIRAWERGIMLPRGVSSADAAAVKRIEWQFELWTKVREAIGVPSWPARSEGVIERLKSGTAVDGLPRRLMVAGLESVSAANLEILSALGSVIDVEALFVHPSPALREAWSVHESAYRTEDGDVPRRNDDFATDGADVLVSTWTRGAFELQMLLASHGISAVHHSTSQDRQPGNLLEHVQRAVAEPSAVQSHPYSKEDRSVQIHRAHNLARQVEVLHDALLHAFTDIPDLQPHDVLVLCADIAAAAPLLRARFERPVSLADGKTVTIPLAIADRALRDVSPGAELLGAVLALVDSRFDVNSVLQIATSPLILHNFSLDDSDVAKWIRLAELSRVRWGLDVEHRARKGLDAPEITAHTWLNTIERSLTGALLPDATPALELGDVVPLAHVDVADLSSLAGLAGILSPLSVLEQNASSPRPAGQWCDLVEQTLLELCGESCTDIDDALEVLTTFRKATTLERGDESIVFDDPVSYEEFAELIGRLLVTAPGRQPLRTGAVTATSFVPLRSVPFRVVCILGLDDGTLPGGDAEGDDLVAADPYMGDSDPRLEVRRVILDAVLAAQDRFIVTCIGRSIKNNASVPLVTPLAELVDLCGRLGVHVPTEPDKLSDIEIAHPRHQSSWRNFVGNADAVVPGMVWSHDTAARAAAEQLSRRRRRGVAPVSQLVDPLAVMAIKDIEDLMIDPLDYYLTRTLKIRKEYGEKTKVWDATLPLTSTEFDIAHAARELDAGLDKDPEATALAKWSAAFAASDALPVLPFVKETLETAKEVARGMRTMRLTKLSGTPVAEEIALTLESGVVLRGVLDGIFTESGTLSIIHYYSGWTKDLTRLAVRLLVMCAAGHDVRNGLLIHRGDNKSNSTARNVSLHTSVTQESALAALEELVAVEPITRTIPCALFGRTAEKLYKDGVDRDEALEAFVAELEDDGYRKTNEFKVFGDDPTFDDVYVARRTHLERFFSAYFGLMSVEKIPKRVGLWWVKQ